MRVHCLVIKGICVHSLFSTYPLPLLPSPKPQTSPYLAGWPSPYFSVQIPEIVCLPINYSTSIGQSFSCQVILQATHLPMNWLPPMRCVPLVQSADAQCTRYRLRQLPLSRCCGQRQLSLEKDSRYLKHNVYQTTTKYLSRNTPMIGSNNLHQHRTSLMGLWPVQLHRVLALRRAHIWLNMPL